MAVEKKKKEGSLTYPLWRGNLFIPWGIFFVISLLLAGSVNLPRFVGLAMHGAPVEAHVTQTSGHCRVTYMYGVKETQYNGLDSRCGLKPGDTLTAFYDVNNPESSTLYLPSYTLQNEIAATALICLCVSAFLVLWFRMTYVIGGVQKQKSEIP